VTPIVLLKKEEELIHIIKFDFANPFDYIKNTGCYGGSMISN